MKTYIFLTNSGSTQDDAGNETENCQQIADVVLAESALGAYNYLLRTDGFYGEYNGCFCYELVGERIQGMFDLIKDSDDIEE